MSGQERPPQPAKCEQCGSRQPFLIYDALNWQWVCQHRRACEARVMLARGASSHLAAAHAQEPRP
jgi:hypothetical protein